MRRLKTKTARAALARAGRAARHAGIPALIGEVESAALVLRTPAAAGVGVSGIHEMLLFTAAFPLGAIFVGIGLLARLEAAFAATGR